MPSAKATSFCVSLTGHPATTFPAWFVYAFSANAENAQRRIIVETIDLPIISTVLYTALALIISGNLKAHH